MTDKITDTLIIHIGLPKTGTSTLSKRCFDHFDNTITGNSTEEWKLNVSKGLFQIFQNPDPSIWNTKSGQRYIELLKNACSKTNGKPLFISRNVMWPEYFPVKTSSSPQGALPDCFPVSLHLKALKDACPWISKFKVMLTLRNQPQWLASLYAQQSSFISVASKTDFEKQVRAILHDDSPDVGGFLNWGKLVNDLYFAVGKNSVYVLLLEEINTHPYWETLAEATELPLDPSNFLLISKKSENVHNIGYKEWALENQKASFNISKYDNRIWNSVKYPLMKHPELYNAAISFAEQSIKVVRFSCSTVNPLLGLINKMRGREEKFFLSDELSAEIRAYCAPFNMKLAELLGREISDLGY